nr:spore coat protein [Methylomusa anaerophila]
MLADLINTEKHISHLYEHAIMESTHSHVYNFMEDMQRDEHDNAFTLFQAMQQRDWYNPSSKQTDQYNTDQYNNENNNETRKQKFLQNRKKSIMNKAKTKSIQF